MLKFFRKHARGWFMLIFMAIIIFVFVLYFGTDRGSQTTNAVAIVDGTVISESEYYNEYSKMTDMVKALYGGALTADMLKQMDLKRTAYDNLINRQIIIAKASDLKLQVSDDELKQMIMTMPALQTDGKFDNYKYKQLLRYNKLTAEDFEASQKINLAAGKIETIIREGIKVSDQEVLDLYALQNQKINLNFVQISGADITRQVTPSTSDLENYLKNNNNAFRVPEQAKIKYLYFAAEIFSPAEISPSDIKDYYNRRKENYKNKDGKPLGLEEAKPMLIKELKQGRGMQNAFAEAKKAHDTIYQEDNFDAYAAKNNLKVQIADFFPLNKPPLALVSLKDLAQQLAGLQKNDISKTFATDNGYYLIRIEDKKAAYTPQLKAIENDVRQSYLKGEQDRIAAEEAATMLEKLRKGETLNKLAQEKGFKVQETGLFQPGNVIPKLGSHPEAMEMLLSLSLNHPYTEKPLKINNTHVIFKLIEMSTLDMKDFEAKKETHKQVAMNLKREEAMKSWLEGNKTAMIKEKRLKINKEAKDL
ncbi:MAG: SurA N-terminal domain-containing protein [Smithellaceae bacterium]|nr:SurA N-terminal domain-containing protein [Smithellaceae bacterium]